MIATTEALVLRLLSQKVRGAYGSELVHLSEGRLKRNTVYAMLNRLEKAGYVKSTEEPASATLAVPRTSYRITASGSRALQDLASHLGMAIVA